MKLWIAATTLILGTYSAGARADDRKPVVPAYWVFLNTGPGRDKVRGMSKEDVAKMQAAHVGNFGAQFDKGKLFTAGPLGDNGFIRGMVVVNGSTEADVKKAFEPDPFIQSGILEAEAYPWMVDVMRFGTPKVPFEIAQYTLGVVKKGKSWSGNGLEARSDGLLRLLPGLRPLDRTGELAISGPLLDAKDNLGILLFTLSDQAKVRSLLDQMPAVKSGQIAVELHPQYIGVGVLKDPKTDTSPPRSGKRISLASPDLWEGDTTKTWRINSGVFSGGSLTETVPHNDFIATKKEYGNFDLRLRFKLVGSGFVNGGVQIRSQRLADPAYEMVGYQADLGENYWGALYDESRRNKVLAHTHFEVMRRVLKPNKWNDYIIRCEGPRIRLWLNGVLTVDYTETDASIPLSGKIGLQVHGGGKTEASYKDITIEELPASK